MSKIRTVKPEFWSSEQVVRCSTNARLLFIGLWNFCDDAGIHPASLMRLKMEVFPGDAYTSDDIKNWIDELLDANLLQSYEVENKPYWQVIGWHHQRIDRPYYKYPKPNVETTMEQRTNSVSTTPIHPRKGKECKGINIHQVEQAQPIPISQSVMDVFTYWQAKLNHPKAKLDGKRKRTIDKALKLYSLDDLKCAINGCSKSKFHLGENDSGTKYDGLDQILRDSEHIEKFMRLTQESETKTPLALDE